MLTSAVKIKSIQRCVGMRRNRHFVCCARLQLLSWRRGLANGPTISRRAQIPTRAQRHHTGKLLSHPHFAFKVVFRPRTNGHKHSIESEPSTVKRSTCSHPTKIKSTRESYCPGGCYPTSPAKSEPCSRAIYNGGDTE